MRVRVKAVVAVVVVEPVAAPAAVPGSHWKEDLTALQNGSLQFDVFARRYRALLRSIVRPWVFHCPSNVSSEDLVQEILLEIWQAVGRWDPEREDAAPLNNYVRARVRYRLMAYTYRLKRSSAKDRRFIAQQIIEEKVVLIPRGGDDQAENQDVFVTVAPVEAEALDIGRVASLVVGGLSSKQGRVVAGLLNGELSETVTARVYGSRCKGLRKATLRAVAAASALVQSPKFEKSSQLKGR